MMSQEYYAVLVRMITAAGRDRAQLRTIIYELARIQLRKELYQSPDYNLLEIKKEMASLEEAIERVEVDAEAEVAHLALSPATLPESKTLPADPFLIQSTSSTRLVKIESPAPDPLPPLSYGPPYSSAQTKQPPLPVRNLLHAICPPQGVRIAVWSTLQLIIAAILGVALYAAGERAGNVSNVPPARKHDDLVAKSRAAEPNSPPSSTTATNPEAFPRVASKSNSELSPPSRPAISMPLPTTYGTYALSGGQLFYLSSLPIDVPDPKIAISTFITLPSKVTLPNGELQFIVFRRDLANSAPDHVAIRIVARVMRTLTFDSHGKVKKAEVAGPWAVRNKAYEMRVEPIGGNPELILIRPSNPEFSFSGGRYALVLKNAAYDFSVGGPITDMDQCLEQSIGLNESVYNECRKP